MPGSGLFFPNQRGTSGEHGKGWPSPGGWAGKEEPEEEGEEKKGVWGEGEELGGEGEEGGLTSRLSSAVSWLWDPGQAPETPSPRLYPKPPSLVASCGARGGRPLSLRPGQGWEEGSGAGWLTPPFGQQLR